MAYGATIGVPLVLLGILVLAIGLSPFVALLVSALVYAGLFLLLTWRSGIEVERGATQDEFLRSLAGAERHVARLRELAPAIKPHLGDQRRARLEGIADLADKAIADLAGTEPVMLAAASRLEFVLAETIGLLALFGQVAGHGSASRESLAATIERLDHDILGRVEASLADLSGLLGEADAENLDVAIRVLERTLSRDGRARTP